LFYRSISSYIYLATALALTRVIDILKGPSMGPESPTIRYWRMTRSKSLLQYNDITQDIPTKYAQATWAGRNELESQVGKVNVKR
jgi:hypothetical protein